MNKVTDDTVTTIDHNTIMQIINKSAELRGCLKFNLIKYRKLKLFSSVEVWMPSDGAYAQKFNNSEKKLGNIE